MLTKFARACAWRRDLNAFHECISHDKRTPFTRGANVFHSLLESARKMYYTLLLTGTTIQSRKPNSVRPLGRLVAVVTGCFPWGDRLGIGYAAAKRGAHSFLPQRHMPGIFPTALVRLRGSVTAGLRTGTWHYGEPMPRSCGSTHTQPRKVT